MLGEEKVKVIGIKLIGICGMYVAVMLAIPSLIEVRVTFVKGLPTTVFERYFLKDFSIFL